MPTNDRDRRITRARAFLAVAFDCLTSAEHELSAVGSPLGRTLNRLRRSVRWVVREVERETEKREKCRRR